MNITFTLLPLHPVLWHDFYNNWNKLLYCCHIIHACLRYRRLLITFPSFLQKQKHINHASTYPSVTSSSLGNTCGISCMFTLQVRVCNVHLVNIVFPCLSVQNKNASFTLIPIILFLPLLYWSYVW